MQIRRSRSTLFALVMATMGLAAPAAGQATSQSVYSADRRAAADWTVLAIAPDGAWGVATETNSNQALVNAIGNCKKLSAEKIGCGYMATRVQEGWILISRCGSENVITANRSRMAAEKEAVAWKKELRQRYVPDMPPCQRVVTIGPFGRVFASKQNIATRASRRQITRLPLR